MTVRTIDDIFRDFVIDGVPSSGAFNPYKPDIRDTLKKILEGLSTFPDNRVIRLNNANTGTANNIVVSASVDIPAAVYQVLYVLNVTQENTGPVTVSGALNRSLVTNTSQPVPNGYLTPGMAVLCIDTGTTLRMLSYGDERILVEEAESVLAETKEVKDQAVIDTNAIKNQTSIIRDQAEAARDIAAGYASDAVSQGNVPIYATLIGVQSLEIPAGISAIRTNGYSSAGDGGEALYKRVSVEPTHAGKVKSEDGAWWELAEIEVRPQMFGGSPNMSDTDTDTLQKWLDHPSINKKHTKGDFLVTRKLVSTVGNARIEWTGGVLVAGADDLALLEIRGDYTTVIPNIDGRDKGAIGVDIVNNARGCSVIDGNIRNIRSKTIGAMAVRATTRYGVTVSRNKITNIKADGNGTIGDNPGSSRAVFLTNTESALAMSFIQDNDIFDIDGEEGDAIHVLFFDGTYPFLQSLCIITGNGIHNAYRRAVKIQGSDVTVSNNKIYNSLTSAQAPHLAAQIDVIASNRVDVEGNTVSCTEATCIQLAGSNGLADTYYSTVTGNKVRTGSTKPAIYLSFINSCDCSSNTVAGGSNGIGAGVVFDTSICENKLHSNGATGAGIIVQSGGGSLVICGNRLLSGARSPLIDLRAPDCEVTNNFALNAVCVAVASTALRCHIDNNSNRGSQSTVTGSVNSIVNGAAKNLGSGGAGAGGRGLSFATVSPEAASTGVRFDRGDVVFNKNAEASGIVGWICIGAGTPGVWKPFGTIAA